MCTCITILLLIIIIQLIRLVNVNGYTDYPTDKPGNVSTAPRHRIDPEFNIRMPMFSVKSAIHPVTSRKLIVPHGWDENSRHLNAYK